MQDTQTISSGEKFCSSCGAIIKKEAVICPKCGVSHQKLEQETINVIQDVKKTSAKWVTLLLLALWLGWLGIHRFYVKKYGTGLLWLITGGIFGIGWLIDFIWVITGQFKDKQGNVISRKNK